MPINSFNQKIASYLSSGSLLNKEKLDQLLARLDSKKGLEDAIMEEKLFSPKDFLAIKSKVFGLPSMDFSELEVNQHILNILPQKVAENYQMIVFDLQGKTISVGLVNPDDFRAHDALEFLAQQQGFDATYYVISAVDFRKLLHQYSGFSKEIGSALKVAEQKFVTKEDSLKTDDEKGMDLEQTIKTAPVAKIVSVIVAHAVEGGASDIHIEPGLAESRVRYRIDGILRTSLSLPNYLHNSVVSRIKVLANLKLDETRVPQDGRIRMVLDNKDVDLRISVLPMLDAEKVVIRVLENSSAVPTLQQLGFSDYHIEIINRNIIRPFGLFLLTGPTGSGKTTTLYSVLNMLNAEGSNITTLEDPIEYYINGINQSQINSDVGFTFASGLRAILRQDPNIIMVGEVRDNETAELVIHAALTGHLVFSTLHTNDALGAVPRLIDMKSEPFLLSSTMNLVMAQRLVRRICVDCKEEIKLPQETENKILNEIRQIPEQFTAPFNGGMKFYHGKGCPKCANSGYIGRVVVGEIIEIDSKLKEMIVDGFPVEKVKDYLKKNNYVTLMQDGLIKALEGQTTIEEILRVSQS